MPRSQEHSTQTVAMAPRIPHLPGAESFMEYLVERYHGCLNTRLVASTDSTETWDILCRDKHVGTYFRSGKAQGYPLRTFDGTIEGYVNPTALLFSEPSDLATKVPVDRVHLEFNTRRDFGLMRQMGPDGATHSVRYDGFDDIPFP